MTIDYIIAIAFGLFYLIFAYVTRKNQNFHNYATSGRSVGFFLIFASVCATYIGPGYTLSFTRQGFDTGLLFLIVASAYGLQTIFVGRIVAPKLRLKFQNAYSIGDIIGGPESHNNKAIHITTGLIAFGLQIGYSIVMSKAFGELFQNFFGLPKILGIIILTSIVIIYEFFGGIKASILTDVYQFCTFVILMPILAIFVISSSEFHFTTLISNIDVVTTSAYSKTTILQLCGLFLSFLLGETLIPPFINRILASKNSNIARSSFTSAGIFFFFWLFLMVFLGLLAKSTINGSSNDQVLLNLGSRFLPHGIYGFFMVALISIVMSSQSALLNSSSIVFSRDIFNVFLKMDDKKRLYFARFAVVFVGVSSIIFSTYVPSILDGLLFVYSIWAPAILIVLLASIFLKNHSWQAGISTMLVGIASSIVWNFSPWQSIIPSIFIGTVLSLITYATLHIIFVKKQIL